MGNYQYYYCPEGIESRYELLVFNGENEPFLPLTEHYHDCIGRIRQKFRSFVFEMPSSLF